MGILTKLPLALGAIEVMVDGENYKVAQVRPTAVVVFSATGSIGTIEDVNIQPTTDEEAFAVNEAKVVRWIREQGQ